jgi:hypothetical protein
MPADRYKIGQRFLNSQEGAKKMKDKEKETIDLKKYAHLDRASLEVFIREFLIRNKEFMREYQAVGKSPADAEQLALEEKWGIQIGYLVRFG